jgi:NADPH:quinone reductase-like Zn-dependent oxidoreductase
MTINRVWRYQSHEKAFRLEMAERPLEKLGPKDIRVRICAASLNYRDHIALTNQANRQVHGRVPLSDGAGEVVEVGTEVDLWKVGDRVAGCFFPRWQAGAFELSHHRFDLGGNMDGMLCEFASFDQSGWVALPKHLDYREAATLPCAAVTAWQALFARGNLCAGQSVLVIGTGGVSTFALQLANAAGAKVLVTSRSQGKLQRAKELGCWQAIDSSSDAAWDNSIWELTSKLGVDHVIEVGGPGTLERSMNAVAASGQIHLIGVLTGFGPPTASLFPLLARNVTVHGIYVGSKEHFVQLNRFLETHLMRPVIDRVFEFGEAAEAFAHLASGTHFGKIVIDGIDE